MACEAEQIAHDTAIAVRDDAQVAAQEAQAAEFAALANTASKMAAFQAANLTAMQTEMALLECQAGGPPI